MFLWRSEKPLEQHAFPGRSPSPDRGPRRDRRALALALVSRAVGRDDAYVHFPAACPVWSHCGAHLPLLLRCCRPLLPPPRSHLLDVGRNLTCRNQTCHFQTDMGGTLVDDNRRTRAWHDGTETRSVHLSHRRHSLGAPMAVSVWIPSVSSPTNSAETATRTSANASTTSPSRQVPIANPCGMRHGCITSVDRRWTCSSKRRASGRCSRTTSGGRAETRRVPPRTCAPSSGRD